MSEADFEAYLALLSRFLRLNAQQRDDVRRELRAHLEEAIEHEIAAGTSRQEAILRVLDDFGDAAELAARFSSVGRKRRWIMRGTLAAACVGMGALLITAFSPEPPAPAVADAGAPSMKLATVQDVAPEADAEIEAALLQTLPEISLADMPLEDVIDWFREFLQVNVHVYWQDLESNGVERDRPLSIELSDVPVERALRLALEEAGDDVHLGFEIDDGVLIIATQDRLHLQLVTEVYDVRDLLAAARRDLTGRRVSAGGTSATIFGESAGAPGPGMAPAGALVTGGLRVGGGRAAYTASRLGAGAAADELLTELISNTVEPDSWNVHGGSGSQSVFNGVLVVLQTPDVQRQVEKLLNDLRRVGAAELE